MCIRDRVKAVGFPPSFVGVVIALLVLLPETLAAFRAATRDRVQISLNLAYGSAMASIGLTIPAIAVASIWLDGPLLLGLGPVQIALLVLLPETLAATRAARRDRVQTSLNLAYGSAMASIGLTIPAIAVASIWLDGPLLLGLGSTQLVLLALTAVVGILTIVPGRATPLQGGVHLSILAAFLFLAISP